MDITRANFTETLPIVSKAIDESSFICIDGEFTGLTNHRYNLTSYDSPEERYLKLHSNTENFMLLQFGMCTFSWKEDEQKYQVDAFNFYIFPFRSSFPGVPDRIFSCQASSLDFLTLQDFDFNKAIKEGIPFLRPSEEASVRSAIEEKQAYRQSTYKSPAKFDGVGRSPSSKGPSTPITDQKTKDFTEKVVAKIKNFLENTEDSEIVLEPCNSYLRKILFENIPAAFPGKILVESRTDEQTHQRHIVVVRGASASLQKERNLQAKVKEESNLEEAVGFSKIVKKLSQSQKLIVGHNMLLDVFYTIQQFVCPLPDVLEEFKSLVGCVFPKLLDTKLMGSMLPFRDLLSTTALGDMNARLREPPFQPPDITVPGKYNVGSTKSQDSNLHEAAYDAYVTGSAFLSMVNYLKSFQTNKKILTSFSSLCSLISPYVNKVFLMRSFDIPYLNLSGPDLSPCRDHVFHLEFPALWKSNDLRQLFSPVGQIHISWINETQCWIGLHNKTQTKNVKSLVSGNSNDSFRLRTYKEYQSDSTSALPTATNGRQSSPFRPSSATKSFISIVEAAQITDTPTTTSSAQRKRPQSEVTSPFDTSHASRSPDEPELKKQKSIEDCATTTTNKQEETEVKQTTTKVKNSTSTFHVPDEW
uniref:poly(A)-specific ribonuclease PARN n=1 Tax=Ciona intestinalis TaxID=7719 RepID=UPI00006A34AC|nr:poly(A)-specific ribonuclease PARN [Ciona intestinalis]|eukprot:XP_002129059.1 poly(A)-specific ribonuclease PARN [Ciona intestinalis]